MNDEGVGVMSRSHDGDKGGLVGWGLTIMTIVWMRFEDEVTGTRYRMMWRSPVAEYQFQNVSCRI